MKTLQEVAREARCYTSLKIMPLNGDSMTIPLNDSEGIDSDVYIQNAIDNGDNDLSYSLFVTCTLSQSELEYVSVVRGILYRVYLDFKTIGPFESTITYTTFNEEGTTQNTKDYILSSGDLSRITKQVEKNVIKGLVK